MKIYIGLSKPTTSFPVFGWLIQWVEARPYDHVYVRLPEPMDNEYMIFQASKEMVNLYSKNIWLTENAPLKEYEIDITPQQYIILWKHVKSSLGIPYSLKEDFGLLLMKIFKFIKNNPFSAGGSAEFCSKEAAIVCDLLGIDVGDSPDNIDPSLLDVILSKKGLPCVESPQF
jgi:hypothetical protein